MEVLLLETKEKVEGQPRMNGEQPNNMRRALAQGPAAGCKSATSHQPPTYQTPPVCSVSFNHALLHQPVLQSLRKFALCVRFGPWDYSPTEIIYHPFSCLFHLRRSAAILCIPPTFLNRFEANVSFAVPYSSPRRGSLILLQAPCSSAELLNLQILENTPSKEKGRFLNINIFAKLYVSLFFGQM